MVKNSVVLGMPANDGYHQVVGRNIMLNYCRRFTKPYIYYEVAIVSERERIPDLSFWSKKIEYGKKVDIKNLVLTIEITHTPQNDSYSTESILDVFDRVPTLTESFMYNYKRNIWTRFSRESDGIQIEEGKDYSRVLRCYMHTLLD